MDKWQAMQQEKALVRYKEVKKLRDQGYSFKVIGEKLGVSSGRAAEMLRRLRSIEKRITNELEHAIAEQKKPKKWWHGLSEETAYELEIKGFADRKSC